MTAPFKLVQGRDRQGHGYRELGLIMQLGLVVVLSVDSTARRPLFSAQNYTVIKTHIGSVYKSPNVAENSKHILALGVG